MYQNADDELEGLDVPYVDGTCGHTLEPAVLDAIRGVYDPEIPVNIVELGLIYNIEIDADDSARVTMTLTAPGCPVAELMPLWVKAAVGGVDGIKAVAVEIVWDPFWRPAFMTEAARLETGLFF